MAQLIRLCFSITMMCLGCSPASIRTTQGSESRLRLSLADNAGGNRSVESRTHEDDKYASPVVPLEKCKTELSGPSVAILHCGAMTLKIMKPETLDFETLLTQLELRQWKRQVIRLENISVPGAVLVDSERFGMAVTTLPGAEARFITCFVNVDVPNREASCSGVLKKLVVDREVEKVALQGTTLSLMGRQLQIPAGCVSPAHNRIRCADAELHWREPNPSCHASANTLRDGFEKLLRRTGDVSHSEQSCIVLGEALSCDRYVVRQPGQQSVTVLASIRGCSHPIAQCSLLKNDTDRFPEPCNQVFSGRP